MARTEPVSEFAVTPAPAAEPVEAVEKTAGRDPVRAFGDGMLVGLYLALLVFLFVRLVAVR